jgi:quinoprotein glucose dehydrogenase
LSALVASAASGGIEAANGDWTSFGRTPANDRHSPLTQITPANVSRLDRAYSVDFQKLDPDVRRGQQSYPLAIGGNLYVTTNDDNVFALDGTTG